ncbi:MAG: flagellar hook assembly protein FlgD [Pseudomonadota bacterium]
MANSVDPKGTTPPDQMDITKRQAAEAKKRSTLGQEDFLKLMMAQLKYQDPMKPLENGEFIGQMAQFSSVQGLQDMKKSLEDMSSAMISNQALQASSLVGRRVLLTTDHGVLPKGDNATIEGAVKLESGASMVVVGIYDGAGQLIHQQQLGTHAAGTVRFTWNGKDFNGANMPPGEYKVVVGANIGGEEQILQTLLVAPVESVTLGKNGEKMTISVAGAGNMSLDSVHEIM